MKIGIGLAAALAIVLAPMAAVAAPSASDLAKLRERGMKEAPALVQARNVNCTVSDAIYLGETPRLDAEGKPIKEKGKELTNPLYEVACSDGPGFLIGDPSPDPMECLKLTVIAERQKARGVKGAPTLCTLPANGDGQAGVYPLAKKAGVACTPNRARWIGENAEDKVDLYEVGCGEGGSYLLTSPQAGSTAKAALENCAQSALREGSRCEYTTKAQAMAVVGQIAAKSGAACPVTNARWVGSKPSGGGYYEVACSPTKGMMIEVDDKGAYVRNVDCGAADGIGGGCTLTQVSNTGETQDLPIYARKLKEIGHPCVPSAYRSLGAERGGAREVVELACSNQAEGLYALIPVGAAAKGETYNCARAEARQQSCRLTDKKATFPQLSDRLKGKGATCKIRDSRGIGQADPNTPNARDVVEVACDGGPGYIVFFVAGSEAVSQVVPCAQAANVAGGCKLQ